MVVLKPLALALILLGVAITSVLIGSAATLSTQPSGFQIPGGSGCNIGDIGCEISKALTDLIAPYILPIIILLVALFILPKAGPKGVFLALVVVFFEVWWFLGIPGLLPPLRGLVFP